MAELACLCILFIPQMSCTSRSAASFRNNGAREMGSGSLDDSQDGEYDGVGFKDT